MADSGRRRPRAGSGGGQTPDPRRQARLDRFNAPTLRSWGDPPPASEHSALGADAVVDCGWGRLVFAHTFERPADVAELLRTEAEGKRDIALYLRDPHVVLAQAPQELFLDPSHTYRLWLSEHRPPTPRRAGFIVRRLRRRSDADAINRLYHVHHMVPVEPGFIWRHRAAEPLTYLVAEDRETGDVLGTATGVDHVQAFADPEMGSSLWCLAVDPATPHSGVGIALVQQLAGHYLARARAWMDLSVMHDNRGAIALYTKLGFRRVPVFCVKHKNPVNEKLFIGPAPEDKLNPYAQLLVDEARRRGIDAEILDAERGYFALIHGGRRIVCRESLSELTTAVAMSRCDDKVVTRRVLESRGLRVPAQRRAGTDEENADFLEAHERVVVKPARGEQGQGIGVGLRTVEEVSDAVDRARRIGSEVLLESFCEGADLRLIVIGFELVAAAVRRPPEITGDGARSVRELIDKQSRRRQAATGGESRIPVDAEAERCIAEAGYGLDSTLPAGETLAVRNTANLHTGGTIHDVTGELHPELRRAAEEGARALDIPVVGLDFMVPRVDGPDYVAIEANERPGLANHEPQPTAERFVDLLFPLTAMRRAGSRAART